MRRSFYVHKVSTHGDMLSKPLAGDGTEGVDVPYDTLEDAEEAALQHKRDCPTEDFGVFMLVSRPKPFGNGQYRMMEAL